MSLYFAIGNQPNQQLQLGWGLRTFWSAFDSYPHATQALGKQAKNGETLCVRHANWRSDYHEEIGIFYGKNRYKSLIRNFQILSRGNYKWWVWAALDLIHDQTSVEELKTEAIRQGYKIKTANGLVLPFEHFECYVVNNLNSWYQQTVLYRSQWRKKKGIRTDCRTYAGQPARNMRRAA